MPQFKPKTRAKSGEMLNHPLEGEMSLYKKVGLFSRAVTQRSAYRYRGVLLQYQKKHSRAHHRHRRPHAAFWHD